MPFYQSLHVNSTEILLWHITESEEELLAKVHLSISEKSYLQSITSVRRKQEWLAVRALLQGSIHHTSKILYHSSGTPYLENSTHFISITHNKEFAVIAINPFSAIGVDIELKNRNFEKVAFRYICAEELLPFYLYTQEEQLCIIWCAKEAAFKTISEEGIDFKEHLRFKFIQDNQFEIHYTKNKLYVMQGYFYFMENSILAITL